MQTQPVSREQLQQALIASGCGLSLNDALANPTLARCLRLTAQAMLQPGNQAPTASPATTPRELAWARRLLSLAGKTDWPRLQAGDIEEQP